MRTIYDSIIIGSGFGGSVAAYHLSKTDEKTLLLERGPWRNTKPVRSMGINKYSPLPRNKDFYTHVLRNISAWCLPKSGVRANSKGLFEFHYDKDMSVLCSSSVGGGSHVYTALNVPPAVKGFWDGHVEGVNSQSMEKHCRWMIDKMGAKIPTLDDNLPNNTQCLYKESDLFSVDEKIEQPSMSVAMDPISVRQGNNSFFGSETGSKRTLDDVLLKPALEAGLEINDLIECLDISRCDTLGAKYRIKCFDHQDKRYRYFLTKKVILGAGTLNTLKILFTSQASGGLNAMPSLGKGFSGNGDIIGYWPVNEPGADFTAGAPCHGRVAIKTGKEVNEKLDITQFGFNGFGEIPLPRSLKARLKRDLFFVGMGADKADGVVTFKNGRLKIKYIQENNAIYSDFSNAFDSISKRSGIEVKYTRKRLLTVHPLGGAKLAADKSQGVVNATGEVFDNSGLYIVDAAALPAAPGSAPSMTISAWARHVSQHIIK